MITSCGMDAVIMNKHATISNAITYIQFRMASPKKDQRYVHRTFNLEWLLQSKIKGRTTS